MFFTQADKEKLDLIALDLKKFKELVEFNLKKLNDTNEFLISNNQEKFNLLNMNMIRILKILEEITPKPQIKKKK